MNHVSKLFLLLSILVFTGSINAQTRKKPLDHSVYSDWKSLSRHQLSHDGKWLSFEINPQQGDGSLYVVDLENNKTDTIPRGQRAVFSPNSDFVAFFIAPPAAVVRQAKSDGKSNDELPARNLGFTIFNNRETRTVENVKSFTVPGEQSSWIFYHLDKQSCDTLEGTTLTALNPITGKEFVFNNVIDYTSSANGQLLGFSQVSENENNQTIVQVFNTVSLTTQPVFSGIGSISGLSADDAGEQLAFIYLQKSDNDTINDSDQDQNEDYRDGTSADQGNTSSNNDANGYNRLFLWQAGNDYASEIAGADTPGMAENWQVSENNPPCFSKSGSRLFFGTAPIPAPQPADTLLPEEKHSVDVWHYRDPLIQPMQLVKLNRERKRSFTAVYHIEDNKIVQLTDEQLPDIFVNRNTDNSLGMGISKLPYLIQNSFESGDYRDVYLVDMATGNRELLLKQHRGSVHLSRSGDARLSPGGNYLVYYSQEDQNWYSLSVKERTLVNLTGNISHPFFDELHDSPDEPDSYGIGGWVENDRYVLIYDRFDIWKADLSGNEATISLTNGYGRNNNIRLRYVDLDTDKEFIDRRGQIMLSAFNIKNKQCGYYSIRVDRPGSPKRITMEDASHYNIVKANDADIISWRKSTFEKYPDLWVSNIDFSNKRKISDANPQQKHYLWGSVKLVEWVSFANDSLQGLLYTPENMEPGKQYPMIVYFYERLSDRLHRHYIPTPSRSTINISYCVSNGYIVFVPDIKYTVGYPGKSAYNAIVSGTKAMVNQFDFIDRHNIGIQGQSWAGYQIAWLITQTDIFKAAMAGAPVSNMISAYGGIRWSTGMSRIYQYEETQSRIGGTIWDQTLRYIENSPVFFANKVNTPLLMMHNDADGAVPWYQGIEYFMALRRLGKPVWMLNYNDEAHNLTRWPNRMDLSQRMYEFFDHYLKGVPAPVWMTDGVPAVRKNM